MSGCIPGQDCATCVSVQDVDQPLRLDFSTSDGVAIVQMHIQRADTLVPQHAHKYDHTSMLAAGSVQFWRDGVSRGTLKAPQAIFIEAGIKHAFRSLEDNTIIYCVHNTSRTGEIEVTAEHQLGGL